MPLAGGSQQHGAAYPPREQATKNFHGDANSPQHLCTPQSRTISSAIAPQSVTPMIAGRLRDSRRFGMGITEEQQERLAKERAEIAARVANFKATQEKFERARDEYFVTTLRTACATGPLPFWS
jgi:hypothetical protein